MANIDYKQLRQIPIFNDKIDPAGPIALPINFDFSTNGTYFVDGSQIGHLAFITFIQTLWVDMTAAVNPVTINMRGSSQQLVIPIGTQGYYPFLCIEPWGIDFTSTPSSGSIVKVILFNNPIAPGNWPSV